MAEFKIINTNYDGYDRLILCLTYESLLTYIKKIERVLAESKKDETILIDQLLITGNGNNRFMSCSFINGKFDFKTAHSVIPQEYYRQATIKFLHDNYCYVENSILTETQRQNIKNEIAF